MRRHARVYTAISDHCRDVQPIKSANSRRVVRSESCWQFVRTRGVELIYEASIVGSFDVPSQHLYIIGFLGKRGSGDSTSIGSAVFSLAVVDVATLTETSIGTGIVATIEHGMAAASVDLSSLGVTVTPGLVVAVRCELKRGRRSFAAKTYLTAVGIPNAVDKLKKKFNLAIAFGNIDEACYIS